jgi:hypothetical protein
MSDETDGIPKPAMILSGESPPDLFGPPGSMILSGPSPAPLSSAPGVDWSPEAQAAVGARLAYATGPGAPAWAQPKLAPEAPGELDPRMMQEAYSTLPIAEAERAVGAAIRFQGLRQYQADLKSGMAADQALARNAPMMFWQASGSMGSTMISTMKGMTQPRMTPAQQGSLDLARQRLQMQQNKPPMTAYQQQQIELAKQRLAASQNRPPLIDPVQRALLGVDATELRRTETEAAKAQGEVPTGIVGRGMQAMKFWGQTAQQKADALRKAAEAKRRELEARYGRRSAAAPATAAGAPKRFRYDRATGKLVPLAAATSPAAAAGPSLSTLAPPDDEEQDYPE